MNPLTPTSPNVKSSALRKHLHSAVQNEATPVITITPASVELPLTPPLTLGASPPASKPISPTDSSDGHITPPINPAFVPLPSPTARASHLVKWNGSGASLHEPLKRHLALLHPNTPPNIRDFVSIRLLSPDRPYGHRGDWKPISEVGELLTAGVGVDAAKGCKQVGAGARRDEELERMYGIARESFGRLEMRAPGVDKL